MIPYGKQSIDQSDIDAVVEVLKSDWLTQGPGVPQFENAVAQYLGVEHAVATTNATSALHLACKTLGLGKGDSLWTSANTFVASANCAHYCGADVGLIDIDINTGNLDIEDLQRRLEDAKKENSLPDIVVVVHFAGQPCDMKAIAVLADTFGFKVIEDASHAIGSIYEGNMTGCCQYSDISVFSFHPVKLMTTGEGGLITTNNPALAERLARLRNHGIGSKDGWFYQMQELGFNYRMTDMQAALGLSQLKRLPDFLTKRRQLATYYQQHLQHPSVLHLRQSDKVTSAWHLYVVRIQATNELTRDDVYNAMQKKGVAVNLHYIPVYRHPYYQQLGFKPDDFPQTESYYLQTLTLPLYPDLLPTDHDYVIKALKDILNG